MNLSFFVILKETRIATEIYQEVLVLIQRKTRQLRLDFRSPKGKVVHDYKLKQDIKFSSKFSFFLVFAVIGNNKADEQFLTQCFHGHKDNEGHSELNMTHISWRKWKTSNQVIGQIIQHLFFVMFATRVLGRKKGHMRRELRSSLIIPAQTFSNQIKWGLYLLR